MRKSVLLVTVDLDGTGFGWNGAGPADMAGHVQAHLLATVGHYRPSVSVIGVETGAVEANLRPHRFGTPPSDAVCCWCGATAKGGDLFWVEAIDAPEDEAWFDRPACFVQETSAVWSPPSRSSRPTVSMTPAEAPRVTVSS